jgi:hypothetical protein
MPVSTATMGIRQPSNEIEEYIPPNVVNWGAVGGPPPPEVTFGTGVGLSDGQPLPAGGYWYIVSGTLVASGTVQAVPVTVTNGPTPP